MLIPFEQINLNKIKFKLSKDTFRRSKDDPILEYLNYPVALDIEVSHYKIGDDKLALPYLWAVALPGENVYGRSLEDLVGFLDKLSNHYSLNVNKRMVIYIHNLAYEFQFIRTWFEWEEVFSLKERKPVKAVTKSGIEFRCSMKMSGMSLDQWAKSLIDSDIRKLTGSVDHSVSRHCGTPLSQEVFDYMENDVKIIVLGCLEEMKKPGSNNCVYNLPLTNTGKVRRYFRSKVFKKTSRTKKTDPKAVTKEEDASYRALMKRCSMSIESYIRLNRLYRGGISAVNMDRVGSVIEDVDSYDIASSYPAVMCSKKYPIEDYMPMDGEEAQELAEAGIEHLIHNDQYTFMMSVYFEDYEALEPTPHTTMVNGEKIEYYTGCKINYVSSSWCQPNKGGEIEGEVTFNGRVFSAKKISLAVNEIDLKLILKTAKFSSMEIGDLWFARKDYLPPRAIEAVLELYMAKTKLKDKKGETEEETKQNKAMYAHTKGMANSVYGMAGTRPVRDKLDYDSLDHRWMTVRTDKMTVEELEAAINDENERKSRFTFFGWAPLITAYARENVYNAMIAANWDLVAGDTDSVKITRGHLYTKYFEDYNKKVASEMEMATRTQAAKGKQFTLSGGREKVEILTPEMASPVDVNDVAHPLGAWEYEGTSDLFKTVGAKRYMTYSKSKGMGLTAAGMKDKESLEYFKSQASTIQGMFDLFCPDLVIPADKSGLLTHTYIDKHVSGIVTDHLGSSMEVEVRSSVFLEPCAYKMNEALFIDNSQMVVDMIKKHKIGDRFMQVSDQNEIL